MHNAAGRMNPTLQMNFVSVGVGPNLFGLTLNQWVSLRHFFVRLNHLYSPLSRL